MSESPAVVASYPSRHEAALAQAVLAAGGISSGLLGDDAGGAEVALAFTNGIRLVVAPRDLLAARKALNQK